MDDKYYVMYTAEDGSISFQPTGLKPQETNGPYFSPKTPTPTRSPQFVMPAMTPSPSKSPFITRNSPVFEEASEMLRSPARTIVSGSTPARSVASPTRSTTPARTLVAASTPARSVASPPRTLRPRTVSFAEEEEVYYTPRSTPIMAYEDVELIQIPNNDIVYSPPTDIVDLANVVTFYAELVGQNVIGVVVQDDEDAMRLIQALGAELRQRETPRLLHYI